jgi:invasion protein IalB
MCRPFSLACLAALLLAVEPLPAAEAPASAVEAAAARARETGPDPAERHEDWALVCGEVCRIETTVAGGDGSGAWVLRLAVEGTGEARALVVATPLPLFLPDGLVLTLGGGEPRPEPWRTCNAAGCEARLPLEPGLLASLRREREAAVSFTLLDGVRVRLPISLLGFTAAERALGAAAEPVEAGEAR